MFPGLVEDIFVRAIMTHDRGSGIRPCKVSSSASTLRLGSRFVLVGGAAAPLAFAFPGRLVHGVAAGALDGRIGISSLQIPVLAALALCSFVLIGGALLFVGFLFLASRAGHSTAFGHSLTFRPLHILPSPTGRTSKLWGRVVHRA